MSKGKDTEPTERAPSSESWKNLCKKINKAVLDYNPKYKKVYSYVYSYTQKCIHMFTMINK